MVKIAFGEHALACGPVYDVNMVKLLADVPRAPHALELLHFLVV